MGRYDTFDVLVPKRDKQKVWKYSHYNVKIDRSPGRSAGITRDWGDASVPVQDAVIDALISASRAHHLTKHDTALILAIVRDESGFNPDAANKEWSASGPGQFMDETGPKYGVTPEARFDILDNADGIVRHYIDCKKEAEKKNPNVNGAEKDRWTYKYYHDWLGKGRGFQEFDKPDGVKQWISPIEGAIGPSFQSNAPPPASTGAQQPPAEKNPPGPYEIPSTASPFSAFSYLDLTRRPNALGPIPPMWDTSALPVGPNRLAGDSPLSLPPVWASPPFQYSPSGATGLFPAEQPGAAAPAPMGYPSWLPPSDSPLFPHRNVFEPAGSVSPWGQPQPGGNNSPAPSPRNAFGPWPGSDLPGGSNLLDPDLMELLERYLSR